MDKKVLDSKGSVMIILVIFIILIVGIFSFLYLSGNLNQNILSKIPFITKAPSEAIVGEVSIKVDNQGFIPATVTVKKGTQVTWINEDVILHRIVSDPHPSHDGLESLDSEEPLSKGDSFSFIFENTGTYTYHSEGDPLRVKGVVIVE